MVQGAIPALQDGQVDLDAAMPFPFRQVASAVAIADEIGFEPTRQGVFAERAHQTVGNQGQDSAGPIIIGIFVREQAWPAATRVEQRPKSELLEEMPHDEDRPPGAGIENLKGSITSVGLPLALMR